MFHQRVTAHDLGAAARWLVHFQELLPLCLGHFPIRWLSCAKRNQLPRHPKKNGCYWHQDNFGVIQEQVLIPIPRIPHVGFEHVEITYLVASRHWFPVAPSANLHSCSTTSWRGGRSAKRQATCGWRCSRTGASANHMHFWSGCSLGDP